MRAVVHSSEARKRAAVSRSVVQVGSTGEDDLTLGDRTEALDLSAQCRFLRLAGGKLLTEPSYSSSERGQLSQHLVGPIVHGSNERLHTDRPFGS
jgi:hypothetical protein